MDIDIQVQQQSNMARKRSKSGHRKGLKAPAACLDADSAFRGSSTDGQSQGVTGGNDGGGRLCKCDSPHPFPHTSDNIPSSQDTVKLLRPPLGTTSRPKAPPSSEDTNNAPLTPGPSPPTQLEPSASSPFLDLPTELLLYIGEHLPPDAILALNLTHSRFIAVFPLHRYIPRPTDNDDNDTAPATKKRKGGGKQRYTRKDPHLTDCARLNIRTFLALTPESRTDKSQRMRCILCKSIYPLSMFNSSSSPLCIPPSIPQRDPSSKSAPRLPRPDKEGAVLPLPSRLCAWHVACLVKIVRTDQNTGRNEWVSSMRQMCMHCGMVEGFERCPGHGAKHYTDVEKWVFSDSEGVHTAECESCGTRWVRTYTRFLNNGTECRTYKFWRDGKDDGCSGGEAGRVERVDEVVQTPDLLGWDGEDDIPGRLCVRETCWDEGAEDRRITTIDLPVRFEGMATLNHFEPSYDGWDERCARYHGSYHGSDGSLTIQSRW